MTATTSSGEGTTASKATATKWNIDPSHSAAHFSVRHLMITNVRGEFQKIAGNLSFDAARPEATTIEATVDVSSINTREPKRDEHLRSADFFDVAKFPNLTFKSKSTKKGGDGLLVTGDLTIHGVTREVVLDVDGPSAEQADPWGNTRIGASAKTKIKRSEFGMTWNAVLEAGGLTVGDEVTISLDVSLIKQK